MDRHYMRVSIPLLIILLLFALSAPLNSNQAIVKTAKKGDTVSFLAIKIYGFYNDEIARLLKDANPGIKDLNRIEIGQKIVYPPLIMDEDTPHSISTRASNAVVTYMLGQASVRRKNAQNWDELNANDILLPGDQVKTGKKAFVELVVNNMDVLRLAANSELIIEEMSESDRTPQSKVKFSLGRVWVKVKSFIERSGKFDLNFPTAIAAVQGTVYQADLNEDSTATLKVYRGRVVVSEASGDQGNRVPGGQLSAPRQVRGPRQVSMSKWVKIVREMQKISFGPDQPPGDPESFSESWSGNWEKLNRERDIRFESE
jgi:phage tail protein X